MAKRIKYLAAVSVLALSLTACNGGAANSQFTNALYSSGISNYSADSSQELAKSADTMDTSGSQTAVSEQKLIRTVDISIEVPTDKELSGNMESVKTLAKNAGGTITDSDSDFDKTSAYGTLTLQIPKDKVDAFLDALKSSGSNIRSISDSSEDVTDQYVDTESRLKVKKELRDKYMEYLKNAQNIEETLQIEDRLNGVIADIESYEAQIKSYDGRIEYTNITVRFDCKTTTSDDSFSVKLSDSLKRIRDDSVEMFLGGLEWFAGALIVLLFVLPIFFIIISFIRLTLRVKFTRKPKTPKDTHAPSKEQPAFTYKSTETKTYEKDKDDLPKT